MRTRLVCFASWVSGAGCFLVAYFNRTERVIEGAYFDDEGAGSSVTKEGEGWTSYAPLTNDDYSVFSPFDFWDPYLWLGMGIAFALAGTVLWIVVARRAD